MSTPASGSIEQMLVSATETPESATDFFEPGMAGHYPQRPVATSSRSGAGKAGTSATERLRRAYAAGRVRRRMAHPVTLIPGDGTGPELAEATRRVLEATGV